MTALPSSASPDAAQADIDSARRTLTAEADGLVALARGLDEKFHRAVELLNVADGGRIVSLVSHVRRIGVVTTCGAPQIGRASCRERV